MINCPYCGSEKGYRVKVLILQDKLFNFQDDPIGVSDPLELEDGKYCYCIDCLHKLQIER